MKIYYPLGTQSKVELSPFGFIPNKKIKKHLRAKKVNEIERIIKIIYQNFKNYKVHSWYPSSSGPDIRKILETIIPDEYFGSQKNRRNVFYIINRILTQSHGEYIHMCLLIQCMNSEDIPWLDENKCFKRQIFKANLVLLQCIVKPLINYFYYNVNKYRDRQAFIVLNGKLQSFVHRSLDKYLHMGYIIKYKKESLRKVRVSGSLSFIPKKTLDSLECRPLLFMFKTLQPFPLAKLKENLKLYINKYQIGSTKSLYEKWGTLVQYVENKIKLYAVKLDLTDAFGTVDLDVLWKIIQADDEFLTEPQKDFLYFVMRKQTIHIQGKKYYYRWNHGLLQGISLSPLLCDLYLSYLMYEHLLPFHKQNTFMHRTVDDILFVSTCDSDVYNFELEAMKIFVLNDSKTEMFVDIGENPRIVYCGKIFNMKTGEVSNSYHFEKDTEMRIKFKFWNPRFGIPADKPYQFIRNVMRFSYVNYCFSNFEVNTRFNSIDTVLANIFQGMCYVAFKLDSVVQSIEYAFDSFAYRCKVVQYVIHRIITEYVAIIQQRIEKCKGQKYEKFFSTESLRFISAKAFIVVLKKRYAKYDLVIKHLQQTTKRHVKIDNVQYYFKLPKEFENIRMRRGQKFLHPIPKF